MPGSPVPVYLEVGRSRLFAAAIGWPGWARSGREEAAALQALLDYAPRYRTAIASARLGFRAPADLAALRVVERLPGNPTTDFGAPDAAPQADSLPLTAADLRRALALLRACWSAFEDATAEAGGVELRKGPRGGGRSLEKIVDHCLEAEVGYLARIGIKAEVGGRGSAATRIQDGRLASLAGLERAAREGIPSAGPRGGKRWSARAFVRRSVWHLLDHAWEIEDRSRRAD